MIDKLAYIWYGVRTLACLATIAEAQFYKIIGLISVLFTLEGIDFLTYCSSKQPFNIVGKVERNI